MDLGSKCTQTDNKSKTYQYDLSKICPTRRILPNERHVFSLLPPPCILARHHLSHLLVSAATFRQKQICASIGEAKHRLGSAIPGTLPQHITPGEIHRGIDTTIHCSLIRTQPVGLAC